MPGHKTPSKQIEAENLQLDERGRPSGPKDAGRDADPLPGHEHREHEPDDEIEEAELSGDDLAALAEDPLKYAEGPDA